MISRQELNIALTANLDRSPLLHRHVVTVGQAIERGEYENHMDKMEADESIYPDSFISEEEQSISERDFLTLHQGDNQSFSA